MTGSRNQTCSVTIQMTQSYDQLIGRRQPRRGSHQSHVPTRRRGWEHHVERDRRGATRRGLALALALARYATGRLEKETEINKHRCESARGECSQDWQEGTSRRLSKCAGGLGRSHRTQRPEFTDPCLPMREMASFLWPCPLAVFQLVPFAVCQTQTAPRESTNVPKRPLRHSTRCLDTPLSRMSVQLAAFF